MDTIITLIFICIWAGVIIVLAEWIGKRERKRQKGRWSFLPKITERRTIKISTEELSKALGVNVVNIVDAKPFGYHNEEGIAFTVEIESTIPFLTGNRT